jgi:hypothetical protein
MLLKFSAPDSHLPNASRTSSIGGKSQNNSYIYLSDEHYAFGSVCPKKQINCFQLPVNLQSVFKIRFIFLRSTRRIFPRIVILEANSCIQFHLKNYRFKVAHSVKCRSCYSHWHFHLDLKIHCS